MLTIKNDDFTSRRTGLKVLIWSVALCFPISVGFLSPDILFIRERHIPIGGMFAAIALTGLMGFIWGVFHIIKPAGFYRKWSWKRILFFITLVGLLVLGVAFFLNQVVENEPVTDEDIVVT